MDARLKMVAGAPHALRHNTGVTFHLFTSETNARIRLLDADRLEPGAEGWVQILISREIELRCLPSKPAISAGQSPCRRSRPIVYLSSEVIW